MAGTDENPIIYPPIVVPDNVERKKVTVWSMGMALDADVYRPKGLTAEDKVPAVAMTHGMGGDKETPGRYACKLAAAGMIAISITHAGWGESQGRIIATGDLPDADANGEATIKARLIRETIDPVEWQESFRSAIDYLEGEPNVDPNRIGAWGTSFGGGTAISSAATDERVKALSVQVPAAFNWPEPMVALGKQRAIEIARGDFDAIPQSVDAVPGLKGTPHFARMIQQRVGDLVEQVSVPTLIMDAEKEELFDIRDSGGRFASLLDDKGVDKHYEIVPNIDHYGIYFDGFELSSDLATKWFTKHL
ncbi:MAG: hypothetical protein CL693_12225 [Cellvibrionaceae bacterium]|nr:hypothetical protein [Cellvibrionaceae bacterium]|tara:strand:+ start:2039 stop:2956 length:918 start_codon:yes stop_codon:yes gene_type:complete